MCVVIRGCKIVAIFATVQQQAPRRVRLLRRGEPEQTLPCGLHKGRPEPVPRVAYLHSRPARRGCVCKTAASCPSLVLPRFRCSGRAGQNGGRHPVNDGHFVFFTVSLLEIHFISPLFLLNLSNLF
nr:MAG TPA: hypothetical protein [Caudoviricetes sp.]